MMLFIKIIFIAVISVLCIFDITMDIENTFYDNHCDCRKDNGKKNGRLV